jgi:hypothetical protein
MKADLAMLMMGLTLILSGCFSIVDTAGLELAYQDKFLAEAKGVQLKDLQNVPENQKLQAADEYRQAEAAVNAYFQQVITEAAAYRVNEPADSYQKAPAHAQVAAFVSRVDALDLQSQKEGVTLGVPAVVDLVVIVLNDIIILNGQRQKEAYDRFVNTVKGNMMKNFEDLPAGAPLK